MRPSPTAEVPDDDPPAPAPPPRSPFRVTRDLVLFASGLAGIGWETVAEHTDRPVLLAVFAAMVGLPAFFATESKIPQEADS